MLSRLKQKWFVFITYILYFLMKFKRKKLNPFFLRRGTLFVPLVFYPKFSWFQQTLLMQNISSANHFNFWICHNFQFFWAHLATHTDWCKPYVLNVLYNSGAVRMNPTRLNVDNIMFHRMSRPLSRKATRSRINCRMLNTNTMYTVQM